MIKKDLPIGFFDSGVGGLSVYSRFRKAYPAENTIYYGDLKNLPYGNKSQQELIALAGNILDFFKTKNVKAVVIACNTSSALAYDYIKDNYDFKIYPIIQSCAKVFAGMDINKLGVFATSATVSSGAYTKAIQKYNSKISIKEIACPNWVSIVEGKSNDFSDINFHLKEMFEFNPDKIILGCTHYPYLLKYLTQFAPKDIFIDPAEIFTDFIGKDLSDMLNNSTSCGTEDFYVSAEPGAFVKNSKLFYEVKQLPMLADTVPSTACI